jgi:two-component system sensor histidine kinase CpxA
MMPLKNISLTSQILISIWATLILMAVSIAFIFFIDRHNSDHQPEVPAIAINDRLIVLLLSKPFSEVAHWYSKQDKKITKKIFVQYQNQELLNRKLPKALTKISKNLSRTKPFIHTRRYNRIFVGRNLLLPNGEEVQILMKVNYKQPIFRAALKDNILLILIMSIFISGLISYLLARHISSPILALRETTRKLSFGDLSARTHPENTQRFKEVGLLADDFDSMAEKLDRTLSSHKHLIQDISHELRSPVARLQLALELAKKRLNIADDQVDIQRIEKECEHINQIINTLLNLPAYELDPNIALQDTVDIAALLTSICSDLNYSNPDKKLALENHSKEAPLLLSNQQLLRSAFENVFKNAQQYHLGDNPIIVSLDQNSDQLEITCCDEGIGINPRQIDQIFKPFYRIDESRSRNSGGYGLGLSITKRAIALHQEDIRAYNQETSGMCFVITLPLNNPYQA